MSAKRMSAQGRAICPGGVCLGGCLPRVGVSAYGGCTPPRRGQNS